MHILFRLQEMHRGHAEGHTRTTKETNGGRGKDASKKATPLHTQQCRSSETVGTEKHVRGRERGKTNASASTLLVATVQLV